jgi:hypothetical protein
LIDPPCDTEVQEEPVDDLRARLDRLEHETQQNRRLSEQRVILAELKVEAMRAGILDLDGLKFLNTAEIHLTEDGNIDGGPELINQLKHVKPWLFAAPWSSSVAKVPSSKPARQKLAKDMSDSEYRAARANMIRNSVL